MAEICVKVSDVEGSDSGDGGKMGELRVLQRKENHRKYEKAAEIAAVEEHTRDRSKPHCSCNSSSLIV